MANSRPYSAACNRCNALALSPLAESVAQKFRIVVKALDFEHQRVHRIVKFQKAHIRLQLEEQIASRGFSDFGWSKRFFGGSIERFDIGPLQANHIQSDCLS